MIDEDFSELLASIKQAGAIKRGSIKPSRITKLELPDVQSIRGKLGLS